MLRMLRLLIDELEEVELMMLPPRNADLGYTAILAYMGLCEKYCLRGENSSFA